ncbi:hypothetical protein [Sulfuriroseicoccus oceanibius]|uniref:AsmA domain-containing protein n=1 Tax=Sulfuriroseicoccus oceanibius TaxID=2707525 RepID=A0A6B3L1N4_9BACT|nr:hypothetical protein [Sulfuriroseicoccus oceanibius]QQL46271.1 hypothetical protein G3M56_006770 [Sulfuriroseicoccus oceanibius]
MDENKTSQQEKKEPEAAAPRSKRKKFLVAALIVVLLVAAGAVYALQAAVANLVTPQNVVQELESRYNARVEIGQIEVNVFSTTPGIKVSEIKIGHRDQVANSGMPLAQRSAMASPVLEFETVEMDVSLSALLARRVEVRELRFFRGSVLGRMRSSGDVTLSSLVEKPLIVNGKEVGKSEGPQEGTAPAGSGGGELLEFSGINQVVIEETGVSLLINGRKTELNVQGLELTIGKVAMTDGGVPAAQKVPLDLAGKLRVIRTKDSFELAVFDLAGKADVDLASDSDGAEVAGVDLTMKIADSSDISVLPSLEKARKKLKKLTQAGITLDEYLADSVTFPQGGVDLVARMENEVIRLVQPLDAEYGQFDLVVAAGGELRLSNDSHHFDFSVIGDDVVSATALRQINEKKEMLPAGELREQFVADVRESLFKSGRLTLDFASKGKLADPDVDFTNELPDPKDYLKGLLDQISRDPKARENLEKAGSELLRGLFNN